MSTNVIIPTRGRPENMVRSMRAMNETDTVSDVYYIISSDDPKIHEYFVQWKLNEHVYPWATLRVVTPERRGCVSPTNEALKMYPEILDATNVAWMGDDHIPRTQQWDRLYENALREMYTGIVYGNDLGQGENLPTQVCMSTAIPRRLGYFCPPTINHLYCDNVWMDWGLGIDKLKYLPNVVVEHMHPGFGKATVDAGYAYSGSSDVDASDREAYKEYCLTGLPTDIEKLKGLL